MPGSVIINIPINLKKNITYDSFCVKRLFLWNEFCKKKKNKRFIKTYPNKGIINSFNWGKKKVNTRNTIKKAILKLSKNKAFLQSSHKETQ